MKPAHEVGRLLSEEPIYRFSELVPLTKKQDEIDAEKVANAYNVIASMENLDMIHPEEVRNILIAAMFFRTGIR